MKDYLKSYENLMASISEAELNKIVENVDAMASNGPTLKEYFNSLQTSLAVNSEVFSKILPPLEEFETTRAQRLDCLDWSVKSKDWNSSRIDIVSKDIISKEFIEESQEFSYSLAA